MDIRNVYYYKIKLLSASNFEKHLSYTEWHWICSCDVSTGFMNFVKDKLPHRKALMITYQQHRQ